MPEHETHDERDHLDARGEHPRHIMTRAGESDAEVGDGEFLSDMEYDEGDEFYEELGGLIEGKDPEDLHTPDLTTDRE